MPVAKEQIRQIIADNNMVNSRLMSQETVTVNSSRSLSPNTKGTYPALRKK